MIDVTMPVDMWTVLANVLADLHKWADPKDADPNEKWNQAPDGGQFGYMDSTTPKITETLVFEDGGDRWGSVAWCEVEYNHYGNRATYGIRSDGSVSCYMN